jgi:hypothetical protein
VVGVVGGGALRALQPCGLRLSGVIRSLHRRRGTYGYSAGAAAYVGGVCLPQP